AAMAAAGRDRGRIQGIRGERADPEFLQAWKAALRSLRIVDAEEHRAGARLMRAGKEIAARDEVGLRALNDALRAAFDAPGQAGFGRGGAASDEQPIELQQQRNP